TMIKEIERLSRLITRVLDLERLESGREELNKEFINFETLINEELEALSKLFNDRNFKIVREINFSGDVMVDKALFSRVLQNLFSNAIKYVDAVNPLLKIAVTESENSIKVNVSDNGKGI